MARRADQHQQVITAAEIVQRATSQRNASVTTHARFDDGRDVPSHMPVPFTEEEANMIDLESPSHTDEHRKGRKRVIVAGLLAAAAVAAIAIVAIRDDDSVSPADQPSPTVPVPPTVPPQALWATPDEELAPGTYYTDVVDGWDTPRIFVTLPAGWTDGDGWGIGKEGIGFVTFSRPDRVFLDACLSSDGFHPGPMTTLDGLVAALSEQGGWAEVTPLSDITVDGYVGKAFQRTAPAEFTGCSTTSAPFRSWENDNPEGLGWSFYDPGEVETLWVLDVGTVIIINTRMWPDHQAPAAAELAALLDSIRIDPA
jgi:hypothetical protein